MKSILLLVFAALLSISSAFCQVETFAVSVDEKNEAIRLTTLANEKIKLKEYETAILLLDSAIQSDSAFIDAYALMYDASMYSNKSSSFVISSLKKIKSLYPYNDELCFYLADIYRIGGNYKDAIVEYSSAIDLSKEQETEPKLIHSYYFNRAMCYLKFKKYDEAIADFSICLKQNPDNPFTNLNIGNCYYDKKKITEARIYWKRAANLGNKAAAQYYVKSEKMVR